MLEHAEPPGYQQKQARPRQKLEPFGRAVGVSLGAPTDLKHCSKIMPESALPKWGPRLANDAFDQDDLYVEMTFLRTMDKHGLDCSIRQVGIDFANSGYKLWCADEAGRANLRQGIAPQDSSHPDRIISPRDCGKDGRFQPLPHRQPPTTIGGPPQDVASVPR